MTLDQIGPDYGERVLCVGPAHARVRCPDARGGMTMESIETRYQALEQQVLQRNPNADVKRLRTAFDYANAHHGTQLRKSGEPYITHPLAVAEIVNELDLDLDSIIAALLHDCIEDTDASHDDISKLFGSTVADLVEGVTKLTRMQYTSKEEEQMENLRKIGRASCRERV